MYLELAVEFRLPIRLPSTITAEQAGFPFRRLAAEEGVVFPDHFDHDWRAGSRERVLRRHRRTSQPGVTEIHVQPAIDTPEVRAISTRTPRAGSTTSSWSPPTPRCATLLDASGAALIGYRARDAMRRLSGPRCEPARCGAAAADAVAVAQHARTAGPVWPVALSLPCM